MLWRPFVARKYVIVHIFKHEYLCNQWAGVTMKFYQKHHLDGGKAASGFGPDGIKTLVSMAKDSSHRVIMEKTVWPLFIHSFLYLQVMITCMGTGRSSKFSQIQPQTAELAALERLKKSP